MTETSTEPSKKDEKPKLSPLQAVLELARRGKTEILPELAKILDQHPEIWKAQGDLARLVEQSWLDRICRKDLLHGQSVRRQLEEMRRELAGETPTRLERVVVDRIIVAWLAAQHAELTEATSQGDGVKLSELCLKRMESANRRMLAAVRSLAQVRRMAAGLRVEIHHATAETAPLRPAAAVPHCVQPTAPGSEGAASAHDRLNALFGREVAAEKAMVQEVPI